MFVLFPWVSHNKCLQLAGHEWGHERSEPVSDLPTFDEIKAEDLPPFGKKCGRFSCSENIAMFYLPVTHNEHIFSVLTSANSTEIAKRVLNNVQHSYTISMYVICYDQ